MAEQQMFKERSATSVLATAPPTFETSQSLFHVYRLEEDVSLLKEGGGRLSVWTLRACSYKTKTETGHQGCAPHTLQGFISVFVKRVKRDKESTRQRDKETTRQRVKESKSSARHPFGSFYSLDSCNSCSKNSF